MDIPLTKAPTAATTAAPVQLVPGNTYLTADALKLRGGPGKSYADLGTVYKGTVVRYLGQQGGGYSYIEYYLNGVRHEGWVLTNYLKTNTTGKDHYNGSAPSTTAATTARQLPVARISNRTDDHLGLVLRSGPSASSSHLGVLPEGTLLYLLGESSGGYTKVETVDDGRTGWVMEAYLDK